MHAEDRYVLEGLLDDLPDDVGNTDTIYPDAHRASVRSTIATSMKREEALRAENAELKARWVREHDLITLRSALSTKGGEDE